MEDGKAFSIEGNANIKGPELTFKVNLERVNGNNCRILVESSNGNRFSQIVTLPPFASINPQQAFEHFKQHYKEYALDI